MVNKDVFVAQETPVALGPETSLPSCKGCRRSPGLVLTGDLGSPCLSIRAQPILSDVLELSSIALELNHAQMTKDVRQVFITI